MARNEIHREYAQLLEFLETNDLKLKYIEGDYQNEAQFTLPEWIVMKADLNDENELEWIPLTLGERVISIRGRIDPDDISDVIKRATMALQIESGNLDESTFHKLLKEFYVEK